MFEEFNLLFFKGYFIVGDGIIFVLIVFMIGMMIKWV